MKNLKNLKKKNIIIGLIAIVMVMSVGFVVNSYYNTREIQTTENTYSEAMEHTFKADGSDFDGIAAIQKLKPNEQYFDGIPDKEETVLVSKNMVLYKEDSQGNRINEVKFYLQKLDVHKEKPFLDVNLPLGQTAYDNKSKENGRLNMNDCFPLGYTKIIEAVNPKGSLVINNTSKQVDLKPIEVTVFKDPQVRLLGEVDETNFITYSELIKNFNSSDGITPIQNKENKWLKVWDKREGKLLYIAKQPIATVTEFSKLEKAGVVYGLDKVPPNPTTEAEGSIEITDYKGNTIQYKPNIVTINNKKYIVRMLKGLRENISRTWSEWDRYMIPLLKDGRDTENLKDVIPDLLATIKNKSNEDVYRIKMGEYSWDELSKSDYKEYVQEGQTRTASENDIQSSNVYRPVLEEIKCYDGACFEGEVAGTNFITYNKLLSEIEKRRKVGTHLKLGNDRYTGGNWLKIYDAREGKTLYIAKKPLTNNVSWNDLFNAGVVYGLDQIDTSKEALEEFKTTKKLKMSKNYTGDSDYRPTTVEINGKSYIIRLLRGHATIKNGGDPNQSSGDYKGKNITNGSEWNRYILPLVKGVYGERFGSFIADERYSEDYIEKELLSENIQLATYSWFGDMTLGNYNKVRYVGQWSWTQELSRGGILRGSYSNTGAADANRNYTNYGLNYFGFRPVLEEIN